MTDNNTNDVSLFSSVHLGDRLRETVGWSALQFGVHVRLCDASWLAGGYLDDDDPEYLCRVAGAELSTWESIWKKVGKVWTKSDDGKLFHPPTLAAIERARATKLSLSERGRKGREAQLAAPKPAPGQAEPSNGPATAQPQAGPPNSGLRTPDSDPRTPSTEHTDPCPATGASGRVRARRSRDRTPETEAFGRVFQAYPRDEARDEAAAEWTRQVREFEGGEPALAAAVLAALEWQIPEWSRRDKEYPSHVKHFGNYLRGRRWRDRRPAERKLVCDDWWPPAQTPVIG